MFKKNKTILILGGSGFVGFHLAATLRHQAKVFATYFKKKTHLPGVTFLPLDLESRNWIKRILYLTQPDILIYAAGSNRIDYCHEHKDETEFLHSTAPGHVVGAMDIVQPKLIYLSNPYVFDGVKGNFHELDTTLPVSVLGRMKLGGENVIKIKCLNYLIIRSSPLFGFGNGKNFSFLDQVRTSLNAQKKIELNGDTLYSFASIYGFNTFFKTVIDSGVKNKTLHYGGLTKMTFADLGRIFATQFDYPLSSILEKKYKTSLSTKGTVENFLSDFSLNCSQTMEWIRFQPLLIEDSLKMFQQHLAAA